jgi:hypothetical protein
VSQSESNLGKAYIFIKTKPIRSFFIFIFILSIISSIGKNKIEKSNIQPTSATSIDQFDEFIKVGQAFKPGSYTKGSIPKGEYAFISPKGGYFAEEYNGQILANENFSSFGYVYVQGLGDITTRGYLIAIESLKLKDKLGALSIYKSINKETEYNFSGYYKVGLDIEPGTYKIESSADGYIAIESGPLGRSKTIENELFQGEKTISVLEGQYLKVNRATISPVILQSTEQPSTEPVIIENQNTNDVKIVKDEYFEIKKNLSDCSGNAVLIVNSIKSQILTLGTESNNSNAIKFQLSLNEVYGIFAKSVSHKEIENNAENYYNEKINFFRRNKSEKGVEFARQIIIEDMKAKDAYCSDLLTNPNFINPINSKLTANQKEAATKILASAIKFKLD